ncbi:O-methyltransferase [Tautonia plasticadhaerens]|uniref:O-methyltransferase/MSMEI_4947 n=1 Tax=Tautonia plasticadhaerens TaxID=2527974 RepID=A0A518HDA0_9BACT|nr:class I SAM-dependent methyltransferase [Tautonia plasticadhaerens]QDV38832.1 Putative O-methyltransferase/MSMEI_4947 [Tautonia plasticadhaerens]
MMTTMTATTRRASVIVPMLGAALLARTLSAQEPRPGPRGGPRPVDTPTPTATTLPRDDGEARILEAIEQARQGERYANVSEADGRLLRQLAEAINAQRVVELGTSTGESGLYFAMALRKTGGTLHTFDIDPDRLAVARENFRKAGVEDLIVIHEGDAHVEAPKLDDRPIDLLFIDAEKEGYDAYLRELLPLVRPGGLILAHNMRRPNPNPQYLDAITGDPALDTTFLLMEGAGMGMTLKKR